MDVSENLGSLLKMRAATIYRKWIDGVKISIFVFLRKRKLHGSSTEAPTEAQVKKVDLLVNGRSTEGTRKLPTEAVLLASRDGAFSGPGKVRARWFRRVPRNRKIGSRIFRKLHGSFPEASRKVNLFGPPVGHVVMKT